MIRQKTNPSFPNAMAFLAKFKSWKKSPFVSAATVLALATVAAAFLVLPMPCLGGERKEASELPAPSGSKKTERKLSMQQAGATDPKVDRQPEPSPKKTVPKSSTFVVTYPSGAADLPRRCPAMMRQDGRACHLMKSRVHQGILYCTYRCVVVGILSD